MTDPERRPSQEVEIDRLLAEEFACDPGFADRILAASGLALPAFAVEAVAAEFLLTEGGYGDLLVTGRGARGRVALLVDDKITAGPALRQAARYAAHRDRMSAEGWDHVATLLIAPEGHGGEADGYDAHVSLEAVAEAMDNPDPARLAFRRAVIGRALRKKGSSGVQVHDPAVHALRASVLELAAAVCAEAGIPLAFPALRDRVYSGDSWVEGIRHADLPSSATLRWRLWTGLSDPMGRVDLILGDVAPDRLASLAGTAPPDAVLEPYGRQAVKSQVGLPVPALRPGAPVSRDAVAAACHGMRTLAEWRRATPVAPKEAAR